MTFVYSAPDGVTATGTLGVDAYDLADRCSVAGTVLFG